MANTYDLDGMRPLDMQGERVPRMRAIRDRLLVDSDWTMLSDAPTDKTAWAEYRQQLRDFPDTWTPDATATFPTPPEN